MSARAPDMPVDEDEPRPGESFLARFHRRKLAAARQMTTGESAKPVPEPAASPEASPPTMSAPTDADMPPLETLTIDSDFTGFLSEKVSESLRRAALRKLFHSAEFNVVDGLDEYAEDFTTFETLGDLITSDMRHQLEIAAKNKAEAAKKALLNDAEGPPETAPTPPPATAAEAAVIPAVEDDSHPRHVIDDPDQEDDHATPTDS